MVLLIVDLLVFDLLIMFKILFVLMVRLILLMVMNIDLWFGNLIVRFLILSMFIVDFFNVVLD